MALSAWKATAQQSISNSAIQSSVKGMQEEGGKKERTLKKKKKKRREIFVRAAKANIPPASTRPLFPLLQVKLLFFSLFCKILGVFSETVSGS